MTKDEFRKLERGDIVRHKVVKQPTYVVTANYNSRVTAARTIDMTNPSEWEKVNNG